MRIIEEANNKWRKRICNKHSNNYTEKNKNPPIQRIISDKAGNIYHPCIKIDDMFNRYSLISEKQRELEVAILPSNLGSFKGFEKRKGLSGKI